MPLLNSSLQTLKRNWFLYTENIMNFSVFDVSGFFLIWCYYECTRQSGGKKISTRYVNTIKTTWNRYFWFWWLRPMLSEDECFDYTSKETPVTYPVCTIRSTLVHCVVWAKSFCFQELLGMKLKKMSTQWTRLWTEDEEEIQRIKKPAKMN